MAELNEEITVETAKALTPEEKQRLEQQNSRLVSSHKASTLESGAKKHWDLFYKRNETRFFKDRHWTTREFTELLSEEGNDAARVLFEVGCGVGNFIFPLIGDKLNFKVFACDLSPRAIDMVKANILYDAEKITAFQCDITTENVYQHVTKESVDIVTLIFVLSAIHPDKFIPTLKIIYSLLKPGGLVLFRDYGLYDMAQIRFKAGHKISDNFYMRQDGTRCYYFSTEYIRTVFEQAGFEISVNTYIHRRTVNKKENIDVPRIFVQVKAMKPI
ncbi:tRNA N(3)-cytidine methyltransferase METTL6 [Rhynchophorus ferrugineus]|uniref:tRNA N(3)-cytidine methyltransferase METTL6 n=1 Tax=Rhynchophorus ferrugineus TaxID=354439 RepID=UPI003FCC54B3